MCQQNLSLFVHECVELRVSLLNEATDRSSTGDYSDENESMALLRLQRGTHTFSISIWNIGPSHTSGGIA